MDSVAVSGGRSSYPQRERQSAHIPPAMLSSRVLRAETEQARKDASGLGVGRVVVNGSVKEPLGAPSKEASPMKRAATTTTRPPHEASGHQTLSAYIQARFDEFSRSQKDVAQYIVDHLDEVAFQTAEELARRANTSSSTVVRFSQALGFEGFPELQSSAREEYRRRVAAGAETTGAKTSAAPLFSLDQSEFETAVAADHVNVEETARKVSRTDVEAAIDAIADARRVLIAGTDQMAFFASYLRHLLMLLDLPAEVVASASQEALSKLGRIDEETLVIGLSAGRPHPLVARAMKLARHRKARTLAITDATLSEVAKVAQIRLYYSSNSPAYVRSHTALLSLIQALAYGVYSRDAEQYADRIKAFRLK
jgi:DNA-binding MurR/RpiR family transcriptional regulator